MRNKIISIITKKVTEFKKGLVEGLTKDDIIIKTGVNSIGQKENIFILNCDRFVDGYQSRLYVKDKQEALNTDGSINVDVLGEVVSVAVEKYFMFPRSFKKNYPEMYKFVEEALW